MQIQRGNTHFGIGDIAIDLSRSAVVDYTHFTYIFGIGFFTRKPRPADSFLKIFDPLTPASWIGFLLSTLIVGAVIIFIVRVHPLLKHDPIVASTSVSSFNLQVINFLSFAVVLLQAGKILHGLFFVLVQPFSVGHQSWVTNVVKTQPGAYCISVWFVAVTFFNFFYFSTLRASLMAIPYNKPMDTVKGI